MSAFDQRVLQKEKSNSLVNAFALTDYEHLNLRGHSEMFEGEFKKHVFTLSEGQRLFLTTSNTTRPVTLVWKLPQRIMKEAIANGLYKPVSLVGRVLFQLGQYNRAQRKRMFMYRLTDKQYQVKGKLMAWTQERVRFYQQHWDKFVNNYDNFAKATDFRVTLTQICDRHIANLQEMIVALDEDETKPVFRRNKKEAGLLVKYKECIFEEQRALHKLKGRIESMLEVNLRQFLTWTGGDSLGSFIRINMTRAILTAQKLNQNLSYLRGDFNSACEDAIEEIQNDEPDHHNPISDDQRGIFTPNKDEFIYMSAEDVGATSLEDQVNFVMMAYILSGSSGLDPQTAQFGVVRVKRTQMPKALSFMRNHQLDDFRPSYVAMGVDSFVNALFTIIPIDLIGGLYRGRAVKYARTVRGPLQGALLHALSCCGYCQPNTSVPIDKKDSFAALEKQLYRQAAPFGARVGVLLRQMFKNISLKPAGSLYQGFAEMVAQVFDIWGGDLAHGHQSNIDAAHRDQMRDVEGVFKSIFREIEQKHQKRDQALSQLQALDQQRQKQSEDYRREVQTYGSTSMTSAPTTEEILHPKIRAIAIPQMSYRSDGLLCAAANGLKSFSDLFEHHVFTKHPFAGLLFTTAYAGGALAVLQPNWVQPFLGEHYVRFSQNLGSAAASGSASSAIASGFLQAKMAAATFELMIHGADSWLVKGAKYLKDDPAAFITYTSMAIGFGALLAYQVNIPWLSSHLREDVGTFKPLALGFAGLKVGVLLVESLMSDQAALLDLDNLAKFNLTLQQTISLIKQRVQGGQQLTPEEKGELERIAPMMLSKVKNAQGALHKAKSSPMYCAQAERVALLNKLARYPSELPHLPRYMRRSLVELIDMHFNAEEARNLRGMVYPQVRRSLLGLIFYNTLSLVGLLLRVVFSPLSGTWRPLKELKERLLNDTTSTLTALWIVGSLLFNVIDRFFRVVFDITFNSILARGESILSRVFHQKPCHQIAALSYAVSFQMMAFRERFTQIGWAPIYALQRRVTVKRPDLAFSQLMAVHTHALVNAFANAQRVKTPQELAVDDTRCSSGLPKLPHAADHGYQTVSASTVTMNPATAEAIKRVTVRDYTAETKTGMQREERVAGMAAEAADLTAPRRPSRTSQTAIVALMRQLDPIKLTASPFFRGSADTNTTCCEMCLKNHHRGSSCIKRTCESMAGCSNNTAYLYRQCVTSKVKNTTDRLDANFVGV